MEDLAIVVLIINIGTQNEGYVKRMMDVLQQDHMMIVGHGEYVVVMDQSQGLRLLTLRDELITL